MASVQDQRSITELVTGLLADLSGLFRNELNLAKAEASDKMSQALAGAGTIAAGLVLAVGALGVLLAALVKAVSAFLIAQGMSEPNADVLSSVIVGVVVGLIAWAVIARGRQALREESLRLDHTAASLRRDAQIIKEKT
ncbi:nutrient deprivation-induced protein [Rhizobium sp. R72]|uniref:phage holin family protein n=1 Tax=unclassified Rhizobium TaxID=2613769 RepID=UPI000B533B11|nr:MULTISPECIES: phage holin family protein [unclassified Rhizobium]OWW00140.1 nutrient deprivation-induced protein [Rhizobium sp. R72]OWW00531.1 nutrient deprivation-induced protein [Rhizobium sp. R711]